MGGFTDFELYVIQRALVNNFSNYFEGSMGNMAVKEYLDLLQKVTKEVEIRDSKQIKCGLPF